MRLLLNGDEIDIHAPHELMTHLGRLRSEPHAEMRIDGDNGATMVLLKNGDKALVRYQPTAEGDAYRAQSDAVADDQLTFVHADGTTESVPEAWTIHVMEAYQALVHFIRSGGMSEALKWQQAA